MNEVKLKNNTRRTGNVKGENAIINNDNRTTAKIPIKLDLMQIKLKNKEFFNILIVERDIEVIIGKRYIRLNETTKITANVKNNKNKYSLLDCPA